MATYFRHSEPPEEEPAPFTTISDFETAPVGLGFNGQILQGTGASVSRIADAIRGGGNDCGQFVAGPKSGTVVGKSLLYFNPSPLIPEGRTVDIYFDLYIATPTSGAPATDWNNQKVLDLENNTIVNSPGIRLTIKHGGGSVWGFVYERSKLGLSETAAIATPLVMDTWHRVRTRVVLGGPTEGRMQVWVDGTLCVDEVGATIMTQAIWEGAGGSGPIDAGVNSFQFGATANGDTTYQAVLLQDNIIYRVD